MSKSLSFRFVQFVWVVALAAGCLSMPGGDCIAGGYVNHSPIALENQRLRYGFAAGLLSSGNTSYAATQDEVEVDEFGHSRKGQKSPVKAFLLSAAVPGLGQWYYGSRVKPFIFLGVEAATWTLNLKWHSDGQEATDVYEAFNNAHWSRQDYYQFLYWTYGEWDDELIDARELSHHLPDQQIQQYFEMTGKYDQFAWGWDDAELNGSMLSDYDSASPPPRVNTASNVPYSANRVHYEDLRDDANKKFDRARKMIVVAIVNRLVSSLEAYFVTKSRNERTEDDEFGGTSPGLLSRLKFNASLKSYHEKRDTPYVKVTYKF